MNLNHDTVHDTLPYSLLLNAFPTKAQSDSIIYDLPESVTEKVKEYIDSYVIRNGNKQFNGYLFTDKEEHYVLNIIIYENQIPDTTNILNEKILKKTNRIIRVSEDYFIPLMLNEDLVFADLGRVKHPDGRVAKKKILFNFDGYSIVFDRKGKIYDR